MRAAIYARYSSENQRPESIDDQGGACRRFAAVFVAAFFAVPAAVRAMRRPASIERLTKNLTLLDFHATANPGEMP